MLTLTRRVNVESFVALAEIGVPSQREEILAVLQLATELDGYVKADDVNTRLLGRPAESPHGQRILMLIESYGLVEVNIARERHSYRITQAGIENLQKGQIMVPEEGSYTLFTTTDPLFKEAILRIERTPYIEEEEAKTYFGSKNDRALKAPTSESVQRPSYLDKYMHGYIFRQIANSNAPVQVNSISDRVALSSRQLSVNVFLELELNADARIKVETTGGASSTQEVYAETSFDKRYNEVLEVLTTNVGRLEVLEGEPTLLVGWAAVNSREAERFKKEIRVEKPTLEKFGNFETVDLKLPILPATQEDAIAWANSLMRNSITTYVDESEYLRIRDEVASRFGKKYSWDTLVNLMMKFEEMISLAIEEKKKKEVSELYWYLLAPRDLSIR
jgi:hypothetical protein